MRALRAHRGLVPELAGRGPQLPPRRRLPGLGLLKARVGQARGRFRRGTGRSLEDRLGQPYKTLEAQLLTFLKGEPAREPEPKAPAKPRTGGAIRTVPRQ